MTDFNPNTNCPHKNLYSGWCDKTYCECAHKYYPPTHTTDSTVPVKKEEAA